MIIQEKENKILQTKSFDNQHKRHGDIPKDLPMPPFSLLLVGNKGSGKSNLILNLVYKSKPKKLYRHFFDKVYVFSPTWKLDPKMNRCKVPEEQIYEDTDSYREIIEEIIGIQADSIENDGKENTEHILMIFTDLAGQKNVFSQGKGIMNKLAFNLRHYKISLIIDTQSLRQINQAFRNNLSGVILFSGISNRLEIQKIYDEFLGEFDKKEQQQLVDYCFDKPYSFLYINFQKHGLDRFYHNFNCLSIRKEE
jgi:GTPase SAR1 family protein